MNWRWDQLRRWILDRHDPDDRIIGAEIGVKEGRFTAYLLKHFPNLTMYAVDPRIEQPNGNETYHDWDFNGIYAEFQRNIQGSGDRVIELKTFSTLAANAVPDESLDFVFIDAQHDYKSVKQDIMAWRPKVRKGGLISGHDYDPSPERAYGVIPAVDELFDKVMTGDNYTWGKWL